MGHSNCFYPVEWARIAVEAGITLDVMEALPRRLPYMTPGILQRMHRMGIIRILVRSRYGNTWDKGPRFREFIQALRTYSGYIGPIIIKKGYFEPKKKKATRIR